MTIQADLWQLFIATLVPTAVILVTVGKASARINELESKVERMDKVFESLARIETDIVWIKQAFEKRK